MNNLWDDIKALGLLFKNISFWDLFIFLIALFAGIALFASYIYAKDIEKKEEEWRKHKNPDLSKYIKNKLSIRYTIFITLVSIFPLLGMFGTVMGLLGLDLTTGDMENIKNNFFIALTSTAWGILFSLLYKIINSVFSSYIENMIEISTLLSDEAKKQKSNRY